MTKEDETIKNTYFFSVPCSYVYEINAMTEEQAKDILIEDRGLNISGDLYSEEDNYKEAECFEYILEEVVV